MKIFLIGMPYSGKSTVAKILAKRLRVSFIDTDMWIEQQLGCRVIDIFSLEGEGAFRQYEKQSLEALQAETACVVATGGGIITTPESRKLLQSQGAVIIYLHVPFSILEKRANRKRGPIRPMLQQNTLQTLYNQRQSLYSSVATYTIDCKQKTIRQIVTEIIAIIQHDLPNR